ncbi:MAG: YkvA family protein [Clostridiaceae bacterium]
MPDETKREQPVEILDEQEVQARFDKSKEKAKKLLEDRDKMDRFLERLEKKLKHIPIVGGMLSEIPILIALVKAYIEKRYLDIPIGSIIAVVGALIYFLSPVDLMPDFLPAIGLVDDAAVIGLALKLVHDDVKEYKTWREKSNATTEN